MSTPAHHNDDQFRHGLEDYREMPSGKVWEGVEAALDQEKKKRRFFFWFWISGAGTSLAAALLLIPVLNGTSVQTGSLVHTVEHVAYTPNHTLAQNRGTNPTAEHIASAESQQNGSATVTSTPSAFAPSIRSTNGTGHSNTQPSVAQSQGNHHQASQPSVSTSNASNASEPSKTGTPEPVMASTNGGLPVQYPFTPSIPIQLSTQGTETFAGSWAVEPATALPLFTGWRPSPRIQATLTVQGYAGSVAYRNSGQTTPTPAPTNASLSSADTMNRHKKFGVYAGTTIKAGLVFNRHWYVNVGVGYETHYFADRYRFQIPGTGITIGNDTTGTPLNPNPITETYDGFTTNTAFGNALIPLKQTDQLDNTQDLIDLNGKLVYQLQQLIFPIDVGYRYSHKRLGLYVGAAAAFHVPLSQKAIFYADSGPTRTVQLNPTAPFNFSLGLEPGLEYNVAKRFTLLAGGSFRYQLLNAYKTGSGITSRPYVLAGHLGLRISL